MASPRPLGIGPVAGGGDEAGEVAVRDLMAHQLEGRHRNGARCLVGLAGLVSHGEGGAGHGHQLERRGRAGHGQQESAEHTYEPAPHAARLDQRRGAA